MVERPAGRSMLIRYAPMRHATLVFVILLVSCRSAPTEKPSELPRGLSASGASQLSALLAAQHDNERFRQELDAIASSGDFEAVMVLTHAMFELPWKAELEPQSRYDTRMPKLAVERRLDGLVGAPEHDTLSAKYFRALESGEGIEAAKAELLSWSEEHRSQLMWDGSRFQWRE